jgi:cobalamin synthase
VKTFEGFLALLAIVAVVALLVALLRDAVRDRREDAVFLPARRRRRLILMSLLLTILLPAIGSQRGAGVALAGLVLVGLWWCYVAFLLRRLGRLQPPARRP